MAREHLSKFNVVATYPDMAAARKAFDALGAAGVDGNDVSLVGPHADAVAAETDTRDRDAHLVGDVSEHVVKGGAIGSVAGAIAGGVAFVIPGVGPAMGVGIWAATLGGAIAGGAVGSVAGGVGAIDQSDDWELTYDDVAEGKVLVATHAEAETEAEKQESVLREHQPMKVERFDEKGRRIGD
jgi:outer membrane lipoprotein SlyB